MIIQILIKNIPLLYIQGVSATYTSLSRDAHRQGHTLLDSLNKIRMRVQRGVRKEKFYHFSIVNNCEI